MPTRRRRIIRAFSSLSQGGLRLYMRVARDQVNAAGSRIYLDLLPRNNSETALVGSSAGSVEARAFQQHFESDDFERPLMGGLQSHGRHDAGFERPFPGLDAHAPAVARLQSGKAELGARRNQVVAD